MAANAFSLSAFTLAIAACFSSSVALGSVLALISAILSSAALFTASIAGCLSSFTTLVKGTLSVDPSL